MSKVISHITVLTSLCLVLTSCSTIRGFINKFTPKSKTHQAFVRVPSEEKKLFKQMNAYRIKHGKQALKHSKYLDDGSYVSALKIGKKHQKTKKNNDGKKHQGFKKFTKKSFKGGWVLMAENVGWSGGRSDKASREYFYHSLINSPEHKKNILENSFNFSSVVIIKSDQYYYIVQRFGQYPL